MPDKAMLDNLTKLASRFRWMIEEADLSDVITECENFLMAVAEMPQFYLPNI